MGKGKALALDMRDDGVLKSASQIVAEVGYLHSDVSYVFPVTPEQPFGGAVEHYAAKGMLNIRGDPCKVYNMHTYPNALDVLKQLGSDLVVSVYTLSTGLARMGENLRAAAADGQPMVVHVAAAHIGEEFEITNDVNPVYDLIGSGVAVVTSSSAIDCANTAIYAYTLAQRLRRPVIHMIDGVLGLSVRTTTAPSWEAIDRKAAHKHPTGPHSSIQASLQQQQDVMVKIGTVTVADVDASLGNTKATSAKYEEKYQQWNKDFGSS